MTALNMQDIQKIADLEARGNETVRGTVIKELLHYDILDALARSELGRHVVFHGGTAIRLCHNGNRYSEDLDFVAPSGFDEAHVDAFKAVLHAVL